jgi:hypothetical protein
MQVAGQQVQMAVVEQLQVVQAAAEMVKVLQVAVLD